MRGILKNGIYTKHENEVSKLRLFGGAWSINLDELPSKGVQLIEYVTSDTTYVIAIKEAMKFGTVQMLGAEKKLVVPLSYWQKGTVALSE